MDIYLQALGFLFRGILFAILCVGIVMFFVYARDVFTEGVENDHS